MTRVLSTQRDVLLLTMHQEEKWELQDLRGTQESLQAQTLQI